MCVCVCVCVCVCGGGGGEGWEVIHALKELAIEITIFESSYLKYSKCQASYVAIRITKVQEYIH